MNLSGIKSNDTILDCGCGIGGSAIFLAKQTGCKVTGITLSAKQVETANGFAQIEGIQNRVSFYQRNYLDTGFMEDSFDIVWAIESFGSSPDSKLFFKEMRRILKPGGIILMADTFKPVAYDIENEHDMRTMLNGWAISDILSVDVLCAIAGENGFNVSKVQDVTRDIEKSVNRIYWAALLGMIGTKVYNLFENASHFSKVHYKTGLAQRKAYKSGKWGYYLFMLQCKD
jgi:cyclopropane fatty-acyl-phospholipid synthase-like methyltransferase